MFGISPSISSWHHLPPAFVSRAQAGLIHVKTGTGRQPSSSISPTTYTRLSFLFRIDGLGSLHISVIVRVQIILKVIPHRSSLESGDFLYLNSKASPGHQKANNEHKQSGAKYIYNFCVDRFCPPVHNRSSSFSQIKIVSNIGPVVLTRSKTHPIACFMLEHTPFLDQRECVCANLI